MNVCIFHLEIFILLLYLVTNDLNVPSSLPLVIISLCPSFRNRKVQFETTRPRHGPVLRVVLAVGSVGNPW